MALFTVAQISSVIARCSGESKSFVCGDTSADSSPESAGTGNLRKCAAIARLGAQHQTSIARIGG
jgi:hypothetical protein